MPIIDLTNEGLIATGIGPQTLTASAQGASNDFSNGIDSTELVVQVNTLTVANVTSLVVQAEEWSGVTNGTGNGGTTWAVIPGMVITVTATTTAANLLQAVRGLRTQQYVRANANTFSATTTTGAFPVSALLISQNKFIQQGKSGTDHYPSTNVSGTTP